MTVLVGHRGAPNAATENTVSSLLAARSKGAHAVEVDVRMSADGVPVLLHDRTFERIWGCSAAPGALDIEAISRLTAEDPSVRVPTLEEAASATDLQLVVDLKDPAGVRAVMSHLRAASSVAEPLFIGESAPLLAVRRAVPGAKIVLSVRDPHPDPALLDQIRPWALNLPWELVDAQAADQVREQGYALWTYCVDTADDLDTALALGVEGVISNDLDAVAPRLKALA